LVNLADEAFCREVPIGWGKLRVLSN